jgi:hypothetical protein
LIFRQDEKRETKKKLKDKNNGLNLETKETQQKIFQDYINEDDDFFLE